MPQAMSIAVAPPPFVQGLRSDESGRAGPKYSDEKPLPVAVRQAGPKCGGLSRWSARLRPRRVLAYGSPRNRWEVSAAVVRSAAVCSSCPCDTQRTSLRSTWEPPRGKAAREDHGK